MECPGSDCAALLLEWLKSRAGANAAAPANGPAVNSQGILWTSTAYQEEAPVIRSAAEFAGAVEHLEYAVFRRYENQLTRAERARLDNTIRNALYKLERYVARLEGVEHSAADDQLQKLRDAVRDGRERAERQRGLARRADLKLAQLGSLSPEAFEEFVAEVFEALGYEVDRVGGSGDEGVDLRVQKHGLLGIVQCKYHSRGVVGSPELQRFLGAVHHTHSHKGYFVTTSTFSLAAERFVAEHPIELIDGPRLVELVHEAMGPGSRRDPEPAWF